MGYYRRYIRYFYRYRRHRHWRVRRRAYIYRRYAFRYRGRAYRYLRNYRRYIKYCRRSNFTVVSRGSSRTKKLSAKQCKTYAKKNRRSFRTGRWGSDPTGCYVCKTGWCRRRREYNKVFYNYRNTNRNCGTKGYYCVKKK